MSMWRVRREPTIAKTAAAVACLALGVYWYIQGDTRGMILAVPATVLLGAMALRDILAPVRLTADDTGLTVVHGYVGRRHIPWEQIEDIRVDVNRRYGLRSEILEIDTGDNLHIFSQNDLSASPTEVAAELRRRSRA